MRSPLANSRIWFEYEPKSEVSFAQGHSPLYIQTYQMKEIHKALDKHHHRTCFLSKYDPQHFDLTTHINSAHFESTVFWDARFL